MRAALRCALTRVRQTKQRAARLSLIGRLAGRLAQDTHHSPQLKTLLVALHRNGHRIPWSEQGNAVHRQPPVPNWLAVDMGDDVAQLHTGFLRRAIRCDRNNPKGLARHLAVGNFANGLYTDSQPAANDFAVINQVLHHKNRQVHRYRKADADTRAGVTGLCVTSVDKRVNTQ